MAKFRIAPGGLWSGIEWTDMNDQAFIQQRNDLIPVHKRERIVCAVKDILNTGCRVDKHIVREDDAIAHLDLRVFPDLRDFRHPVRGGTPGSLGFHKSHLAWFGN
jgi:hypothetical protein